MRHRTHHVALLLAGSGFCALVYQIAWMRELRLIFGGTTAASAAVLAIFMGGLGAGSAILGRRADPHPRPLGLYATLEALITISALLTPLLLWLVQLAYLRLGGAMALGTTAATLVRLVLSALVLGVPTFLMGGTLPAAARSVQTPDDAQRRHVAWLYGINTLGAVAGAAFATFLLLELLGTRRTLWLGCGGNAVVSAIAFALARRAAPAAPVACAPRAADSRVAGNGARPPCAFVLLAAGAVGFAFFLMELVWFRMLAPILGGTTYTFGLILAVALFGIGAGSALYAVAGRRIPVTLRAFAVTCALEALVIAVPYALGDRVALAAALLHPQEAGGFGGYVFAWTSLCSMVVLPAAIIAGFQFPLIIALLGGGDEGVGADTGSAYACNTLGAIAGALAGGFAALPLLTAPGAWRGVVVLLAVLGALAAVQEARRWRAAASLPWRWRCCLRTDPPRCGGTARSGPADRL